MKKLFSLIVFFLFLPSVQAETDRVNGYHYSPYLFFQEYDYEGEGNEFAGYKVTVTHPINEEGIYQFRLDGGGTSIAFVYQLKEEGIVELSYFPDEYGETDYRQHPDTLDDLQSLVLPAQVEKGQRFISGYSQNRSYLVEDILESYEVKGTKYERVLVLRQVDEDENTDQYYYLAPGLGFIHSEFVFHKQDLLPITEDLKEIKIPLEYDLPGLNNQFDFKTLKGANE